MNPKLNCYDFEIIRGDFLYYCPRRFEEIYENDILFIIDGNCYCLDCRRPSMLETSSFNLIKAGKTPTEKQLAEIIRKADLF